MKIVITGHTAGIGKAFAEKLRGRNHDIVGISRSDGENIRRVPHTASLIEPCDLFINNAQCAYAQTELLYEVWTRWQGQQKYIWNISTMMTERPVNGTPDGHDDLVMSQYRNQKLSMEEASRQLKYKSGWPRISIIRPGGVGIVKSTNDKICDAYEWVDHVINTFTHNSKHYISELSIGHTNKRMPL